MFIELDVIESNLKVNQKIFNEFLEDIYMSFYRKDRFRHINTNDERYPQIRITDDIFKLKFFFKDKKNTENYMRLDGFSNLSGLTINSVDLNKYEFHASEANAVLHMLELFSKLGEGYFLVLKNNFVTLIENGKSFTEKEILNYMVETPEEERKNSFKQAFSEYQKVSVNDDNEDF